MKERNITSILKPSHSRSGALVAVSTSSTLDVRSSRRRDMNTEPASPPEMANATDNLGLAHVRRILENKKREERFAKTHCSFCRKDGGDTPLKTCARCRCAVFLFLYVRDV